MSNLPDPETLATLVSNVTQTMCGFSFIVASADRGAADQGATIARWRTAILEVSGERPWKVTVFSDREGCAALGAALCECPPTALENEMIEDSLCELLNMAAGQIKALLSEDERLGLPRIITSTELAFVPGQGVLLRSQESMNLMMWISQAAA